MKLVFSIAILLSSVLSIAQENIYGFWHDSPHVGSGLGNYYAFFDNNNFVYSTNSMDCDQRLESYSGVFTIKEDTLILYIRQIDILLDGKIEEDNTSCYNGYYIDGGDRISIETRKDYERKYKIAFSTYSIEEFELEMIQIGTASFYLLSKDPSVYIND
ncbi:MAG: hypothetical protein JXR53_00660 [Bacteroidales bacterium]|nr:hypothetical protein [Bacteroidales bacterium]